MILPDVNVLLYALRKDMPQHEPSIRWLNQVVDGPEVFGIAPQALASVIRIATHRKAFPVITPLKEAFEFAEYLLNHPLCHVVQPASRHWAIYSDICRSANAVGPLSQDAWFAALAIEHGCEWITLDRDYDRFPNLRWRRSY